MALVFSPCLMFSIYITPSLEKWSHQSTAPAPSTTTQLQELHINLSQLVQLLDTNKQISNTHTVANQLSRVDSSVALFTSISQFQEEDSRHHPPGLCLSGGLQDLQTPAAACCSIVILFWCPANFYWTPSPHFINGSISQPPRKLYLVEVFISLYE